jgi:hypothetical protein
MGQPSVGAGVALQQWRLQGTDRALVQVGAITTTDERGAYRFFGLAPGEYVVSAIRPTRPNARPLTAAVIDAALRPDGVPPPAGAAPPASRSSTSYYPGTARASDAQPVTVAAGDERGNVDFSVRDVQTARIDGIVVGVDGGFAPGAAVFLRSTSGVLQTVAVSLLSPEGRFAFPNLAPGPYRLVFNSTGPAGNRFATADVEVAGVDMAGVQLTVRPALTFSGVVHAQGGTTPPPVAGRRVPFRTLNGGSGSAADQPQVSPITAAGTFTVTSLMPGRYLLGGPLALGPTAETIAWTLQSVMVDGKDMTDLPVDIADVAPKDVVLTYTDQWQELSGRLQSGSGAAVSDVTIVAFPADKAYWFQGSRRIVTARPGTDGVFTLSSRGPATLPAGHYLIATVTDLGRDEQFDPAFLSALVPGAIAIDLLPGDRKRQDLAVR